MNRPLWWDVPMPPAVAKLPRTPSGMPVVYVTEYDDGGDHDVYTGVTHAVRFQDCTCTFGKGRPMIGKLCARRGAQAMMHSRCGVCGIKIRPGSEVHYVGMVSQNFPEHGGELFYSREPGVHADCATYSLLACPALARSDSARIVSTRRAQLFASLANGRERMFVPMTRLHEAAGTVENYQLFVNPLHEHTSLTRGEWLAQARPLDRPSLKAVLPQRPARNAS